MPGCQPITSRLGAGRAKGGLEAGSGGPPTICSGRERSVVAGLLQDGFAKHFFIKAQDMGAVLEGQMGFIAVEPGQSLFTVIWVQEILDGPQDHASGQFPVAFSAFQGIR